MLAAGAGLPLPFSPIAGPRSDGSTSSNGLEPIWGTWESAYRIDDLYGATLVAPGKKAAELAAFGFDLKVIDGAVNGVGRLVRSAGTWTRTLQTGYVRNYGALFLGGTLVIVIWLVASS